MAALPNVQGYDMTRCSITCMEPGCLNKIYYETDKRSDDYTGETPLYCEQHRTEEGRHSATRKLR